MIKLTGGVSNSVLTAYHPKVGDLLRVVEVGDRGEISILPVSDDDARAEVRRLREELAASEREVEAARAEAERAWEESAEHLAETKRTTIAALCEELATVTGQKDAATKALAPFAETGNYLLKIEWTEDSYEEIHRTDEWTAAARALGAP